MPVSERIARERQARYDARRAHAETVVPKGLYCYAHTGNMVERTMENGQVIKVPETKPCPFYKRHPGKPAQRNGYCRFLKAGDWTPHPHGTMLLWDAVKECGINHDDDADDDQES